MSLGPIMADIKGLALTDTDNLGQNKLQIAEVIARANVYQMSLGKVVMDKVLVSTLQFDQPRQSPGTLVAKPDAAGGEAGKKRHGCRCCRRGRSLPSARGNERPARADPSAQRHAYPDAALWRVWARSRRQLPCDAKTKCRLPRGLRESSRPIRSRSADHRRRSAHTPDLPGGRLKG